MKNHGAIVIGTAGIVCSVIDLGIFTILGLLIVGAADSFLRGVEPSVFYAGIILGAAGIVLGIIGASMNGEKSICVVAIIAGCFAIAMTFLI